MEKLERKNLKLMSLSIVEMCICILIAVNVLIGENTPLISCFLSFLMICIIAIHINIMDETIPTEHRDIILRALILVGFCVMFVFSLIFFIM